jgi:hypothetical protein
MTAPLTATNAMFRLAYADGSHPDYATVLDACSRLNAPRQGNGKFWAIDDAWGRRIARDLGCRWNTSTLARG